MGIYMEDYPDPADLDAAVTSCLEDMRLLGMNSTDFFLSGHSLGGKDADILNKLSNIWEQDRNIDIKTNDDNDNHIRK